MKYCNTNALSKYIGLGCDRPFSTQHTHTQKESHKSTVIISIQVKVRETGKNISEKRIHKIYHINTYRVNMYMMLLVKCISTFPMTNWVWIQLK